MIAAKQALALSLLMIIIPLSALARTAPMDSVGIRTVNQSAFIVHKVEKGETLYALARRYKVDVQSIFDANPNAINGINIGQEILIPTKGTVQPDPEENQVQETSREDNQVTSAGGQGDKVVHRVIAGESLFLIGQKYGVSVNDIKKWNNLRSNTISVGQRLNIYPGPEKAAELNRQMEVMETQGKKIHIVSAGETLFAISNKYNVSVSELREWNRLDSNSLSIGQELIVGYLDKDANAQVVVVQDIKTEEEPVDEVEVKTVEVGTSEMQKTENTGSYKKVSENGIAEVIQGSETTNKYLALHRNAAIGTIMQIKNEMNDLSVFVRVIGKIPDTDDNRNVLIKVSKVAYDRLGAINDQFPVEITYHP
ncbi:MAG: LysM peptidoglycan-binding domain-containing protein [Cyclobacteriaceae bacterium]